MENLVTIFTLFLVTNSRLYLPLWEALHALYLSSYVSGTSPSDWLAVASSPQLCLLLLSLLSMGDFQDVMGCFPQSQVHAGQQG